MVKLTPQEQDKLIKKEIKRWNDVFKDLSADKKEVASRLVERAAFMSVTLKILEDDIKFKGPTYKFEQGVQKMYVENPSQKSYNTMINRYTATCSALFNLLPKEVAQEQDDGFDTFIGRR